MTIILNSLLNLFYTKHHLNNEFIIDFLIKNINLIFSNNLKCNFRFLNRIWHELIHWSIFSVLVKLSEHSEFFVSAEKYRRLAMVVGFAAMSNPTEIKIKKLNDYKLAIEQPYYKNLFSFLNGV